MYASRSLSQEAFSLVFTLPNRDEHLYEDFFRGTGTDVNHVRRNYGGIPLNKLTMVYTASSKKSLSDSLGADIDNPEELRGKGIEPVKLFRVTAEELANYSR